MNKQERSLEKFTSKRNEWLEHFAGEDENSITSQLYNLVWYASAFRVIKESRSLVKNDSGEYEMNGMIHNFIDNCFVEYQIIAIRRLLDRDRKRTYSLYSLLLDMEANHHLITRHNYFKVFKIEYDVEKIKKQHDKYMEEHASSGGGVIWMPPDLIYHRSEQMHDRFDKMSNTNKTARKLTDKVPPLFFEKLRDKLDELREIEVYANNFVAHIASPDNRSKCNVDEIKITIEKIWEAHEVICKVATLTGKLFLDGLGGFLGTTQFDQFEYIDRPFVEAVNIDKLKDVWNSYLDETESWAYFDIDNYNDFIKNDQK